MKVCLKYKTSDLDKNDIKVLTDFVKFQQENLPLNKDVNLFFVDNRDNNMTTGVRMPQSEISVLAKGRLLIDILRTLSHEWVHEYQHQKMGVNDFSKSPDIGGPHENMANALSGIFMKRFQKEYPQHSEVLYCE
jgi:hypothetical protein